MNAGWQFFVIEYDPDPVPLTGLRLGFAELRYSLAYKSLLPGTRLRDEQSGLAHTVIRRANGVLALEPPLEKLARRRGSSAPPGPGRRRKLTTKGTKSTKRVGGSTKGRRARISAEPGPRPRKTRQPKRLVVDYSGDSARRSEGGES